VASPADVAPGCKIRGDARAARLAHDDLVSRVIQEHGRGFKADLGFYKGRRYARARR
jgi:hypothetical protein